NYSDKILALGKVDGKLYGLAFNASSPIMMYNAELVKKAGGDPEHMPDTWDGVLALAKKIRDAGGNDVAGLAYNVNDWPDRMLYHASNLQGHGHLLRGKQVPP